ncbi:hypothetical protein [Pseudooceanicola sp.]|uniref:hypothetical protein n=1 Tax=Pseudooceanicola sp. TaxID=1914328 RepID=UPI0040583AF4
MLRHRRNRLICALVAVVLALILFECRARAASHASVTEVADAEKTGRDVSPYLLLTGRDSPDHANGE